MELTNKVDIKILFVKGMPCSFAAFGFINLCFTAMKLFLRLVSYARPWSAFVPHYLITTILAVVFGALNFTLLIPLFDVLFENVPIQEAPSSLPNFALEVAYFKEVFSYYFFHLISTQGKFASLQYVCGIILLSVFLSNLFFYLSNVIINKAVTRTICSIRQAAFAHLINMQMAYFSDERKGDLMSRLTNDVQEIENVLVAVFKSFFKEPLTIVIYFIVLFYTSVELTIFTLLFLPFSGFVIAEITKRLRKQGRDRQQLLGRVLNLIEESLGGLKVIKAFNAESFILGRFAGYNNDYKRVTIAINNKVDMASPLSQVMGVSVVMGILLYGGSLVLNNDPSLSAAQFLTYIAVFSQILPAAKGFSTAMSTVQRGLVSMERLVAVLDTPAGITDGAQAVSVHELKEGIGFEQVSFAYREVPVLKNISFNIKKGQKVALVGPSGGGKSTLADLLPRFYEVQQGRICIDGIDIRDYPLHSLRALMGIVTQESVLFNDTVHHNIAFANTPATREEVINAAKIANAHDFIMQMEHGYDTPVGDRGGRLSGGQRQRISIARAVLQNPPILILDEATSALDTESEKLVQQAIENLMKDRTSLVIAHRLSTIQNADHIIVLQEGTIVEQGRHDELLRLNGLYARLVQMQAF